MLDFNPYSPPQAAEVPTRVADRSGDGRVGWIAGVTCLWLAIACLLVGFFSIFLPNSPPGGWLIMALALFVTAGYLTKRRYRIAAILGLAICCFLIVGTFLVLQHRHQQFLIQKKMQQAIEAESRRLNL